jgi:hypothetical protein
MRPKSDSSQRSFAMDELYSIGQKVAQAWSELMTTCHCCHCEATTFNLRNLRSLHSESTKFKMFFRSRDLQSQRDLVSMLKLQLLIATSIF